MEYIVIEQEKHMSEFEFMEFGIKKKVKDNALTIRQLKRFSSYGEKVQERFGFQQEPYQPWEGTHRESEGSAENLIKSSVKVPKESKDSQFMKAVNNLEAVKWKVNPMVAEVAVAMKDELSDTIIKLNRNNGEEVEFDCADIMRISANGHLKGEALYRGKNKFMPHRGNSSKVKELEIELNKGKIRLNKVKSPKKIAEVQERVNELQEEFDKLNREWSDKQLCLRTVAKANRDKQIIKTIKDLDYSFHMSTYLDYRGRVYYRSPYFSFQSSDLARGNFLFAEGKPMNESGRKAMFIHVASSYNQSYTVRELTNNPWTDYDYVTQLNSDGLDDISVDKMSVNDKEQWTYDNFEMFLEVAFDPIGTRDVWMAAEKPWTFLSLCFEMAGIIANLDNLESVISHMPVAIDGVNNGTQHLAAVSRDLDAGQLVGLTDIEVPKDFYITIAKGMKRLNTDNSIGAKMDKMPMKKIRKGISKRGSMTRAYDAGKQKIGEIIYQDCYDEGYTSEYNITKNDSKELGKDLVKVYDETCKGPVKIKKYLQALVKHRIEEMDDKDITWRNPAGFPALTHKMVTRRSKFRNIIDEKQVRHRVVEETTQIALAEHMSAIGANWVHSNDSAHMMLVINELADKGITSFGAIHDSFSVHACDIEQLTATTKEIFIAMYDQNCLANMREQLIDGDRDFDEQEPELGELNLEDIRDSDFFFC